MNRQCNGNRPRTWTKILRVAFAAALACLFATLADGPLPAQTPFGDPSRPSTARNYRFSVEDREVIVARGLEGWSADFNAAAAAFRAPIETAAEHLHELRLAQAAPKPDEKKIAELKTALAADRTILAALKTRTAELAALDKTPGLLDSGRDDGPFAELDKHTIIGAPQRVDLNADGIPDIVAASHYSGILIWLADGKGGWTASTLAVPQNDGLCDIVVGDLNADKLPDIVGAYSRSTVLVHLADGKGGWVTAPLDAALKNYAVADLALADIDGDKKTDVVLLPAGANEGLPAGPLVYRGSGGGGFSRLNVAGFLMSDRTTYGRGSGICVADLNADGNEDLVIAHEGRFEGGHAFDAVWFGDGGRNFVPASVGLSFGRLPWETFACAEVADLDADGTPDIIMGCLKVSEHYPHGVQACLSSGHGVWRPASEGLPVDPVCDIETADLDGDGKLDVVAAGKDRLIVALGDGAGRWRMLPPVPIEDRREHVSGVTTADIDGDGHPDIIVTTTSGQVSGGPGMGGFGGQQSGGRSRIRVWLNRPAGAALKKRIDDVDAAIATLGISPATAATAPKAQAVPQTPKPTATAVDEAKMPAMLASRYYDDRLDAMLALLKAGPGVLPKIREGLAHEDPQMRASCLDLLAIRGDTEKFARIAALAEDTGEPPLVRRHALRALELLDPMGTRLKGLGGPAAARLTKAIRANDPDGSWKYEIEGVLLPLFVNYGIIDTEEYDEVVAKIKIGIKNDLANGDLDDALRRCHEIFGYSRGALEPSACDMRVLVERPADEEIAGIVLANLKQYRKMYDIEAQVRFERIVAAGNAQALSEFLRQYSYTTVAPRVLAALVATEYERCSYLKVVMDWRRYPWLHAEAALKTRLTVLASLLEFDLKDEARTLADDIAAAYPGAKARIHGTETPIADYVKGLFENSGEAARAAARPDPESVGNPYAEPDGPRPTSGGAHWSRHLGEAYRMVMSCDRGDKALLPWEDSTPPARKDVRYPFEISGRGPAGNYPYYPVSDGERIVFNNGVSVWCVGARDGKPLWRYDNPIDSVAMLHKLRYVPLERTTKYPYSLIVPSRGMVYVVMENFGAVAEALRQFAPTKNPNELKALRTLQKNSVPTGSTVICLDMATGQRLWKSAATFGNFGKARVRSPLRFVDGHVVFTASSDTILGGVHGITFELVALDAGNGSLAWSKSMGDWRAGLQDISARFAFSGGNNYYYDMIAPPPNIVSGNAIVEAGGMLASISVYDGRINWITRFRESPMVREKNVRSRNNTMFVNGRSTAINETALVRPPLVCGDRIYIMPAGSEHLMAYDLVSGRLLWMLRVADSRTGTANSWSPTFIRRAYSDMLAGPDGTVCVFGKAGVALVGPDGTVLWRNSEPVLDGSPVIGGDNVAVPTANGEVAFLAIKDGRRTGTARIDVEGLLTARATQLIGVLAYADKPEDKDEEWRELMGICTESNSIVEKIAAAQTNPKRKEKYEALVARLKLYFGNAWGDNAGRFKTPEPAKETPQQGPMMPPTGPLSRSRANYPTGGNLLFVDGKLFFVTNRGFVIALAN